MPTAVMRERRPGGKSESPRIVRVERDLKDPQIPTPCCEQGHLPLELLRAWDHFTPFPVLFLGVPFTQHWVDCHYIACYLPSKMWRLYFTFLWDSDIIVLLLSAFRVLLRLELHTVTSTKLPAANTKPWNVPSGHMWTSRAQVSCDINCCS